MFQSIKNSILIVASKALQLWWRRIKMYLWSLWNPPKEWRQENRQQAFTSPKDTQKKESRILMVKSNGKWVYLVNYSFSRPYSNVHIFFPFCRCYSHVSTGIPICETCTWMNLHYFALSWLLRCKWISGETYSNHQTQWDTIGCHTDNTKNSPNK